MKSASQQSFLVADAVAASMAASITSNLES